MLWEENCPLRRVTYHYSPTGFESAVEEIAFSEDELEDCWDLTSFPGPIFTLRGNHDLVLRRQLSHMPSHLSVGGKRIRSVTP